MGADANYLKTVEMARGEYCWFLGSDDTIESNAIQVIFKELATRCDIYLCSEFFCDRELNKYKTHYLLRSDVDSRSFDFTLREDKIEYFSLAQSHSALFGYLSSIIFKRDRWVKVKFNDDYMGSLYSHMFMLYSFMEDSCILRYIRTPLVNWRSGNDSFGGPGKVYSRFMIDIDGFIKIMNTFFVPDKEVLTAFRGAFRRHHPFSNIAYLRLHTNCRTQWSEVERKLVDNYEYPRVFLNIIRSDLTKPFLYIFFIAQRIYRKFIREMSKALRY
jgi:abequosyltransferase